jgi:hypothetical protein
MSPKKDAWKQFGDLKSKFTKVFQPKKDLKVTALAHERCVKFELGYWPQPSRKNLFTGKPSMYYHQTTRNVITMRELAQALLDACDFVDASNPEWADRRYPTNG